MSNIYRGIVIPGQTGLSGCNKQWCFESVKTYFRWGQRKFGLRVYYPHWLQGRQYQLDIVNWVNQYYPVYTYLYCCQDGSAFTDPASWTGEYPDVDEDEKRKLIQLRTFTKTKQGFYLGTVKDAYELLQQGITHCEPHDYDTGLFPESLQMTKVCSIGSDGERWAAFTHYGFQWVDIGHVVQAGDPGTATQTYPTVMQKFTEKNSPALPVGFKVKNVLDSKRVAIVIARSMSDST
ncbi:hypothetical protein [Acaryochloris sp. IP29b_bin.137]|uniref:hypothetical protein n=1 Tax=Acaryochloris sp. IP29b_bin.137 TaxID=2969217 RepID=UPI002632A59B|nr:hypothetical protein [Acaryochloris sp. IP29b_bin.137]